MRPFATADERRQRGVDYVCATRCGAVMTDRTTKAGGCFLTLCILGGFVAGLAINNPMKGILIGTAAGVVLAIVIWLTDRPRG